ncbi:MAG TPA: hypothetical protein VIH71_16690 [Solirubrobacteraceae bacterium]
MTHLAADSGWRASSGRGRLPVLLAVLAGIYLLVHSAIYAAPAAAATSYTWSGGGEAAFTADNWSDGANWLGGVAPTSSSSIGTLAFPELTSGGCTVSPPTDVCYLGDNDLSNLTVNSIAIEDDVPYGIYGDAITLNSGGITATAAAGAAGGGLNLPITLGASQTWAIEGGWLSVGAVTGTTDALNIDLSSAGTLSFLDGENEVGALAIVGSNPSNIGPRAEYNGRVIVGVAASTAGLNSADAQPVSLSDAGLLATYGSVVGPLTSTGGSVAVSEGATLTVNGRLTLNATSVLEVILNQSSTTPGAEFAQLKASGTIDLANASLSLSGGGNGICSVLKPGDMYTLVTTAGSLEGSFAGIPNGSAIPLSCTPGEPATVKIDYTAHAVTATVISAGSSTSPPSGGETGGGNQGNSGQTPVISCCDYAIQLKPNSNRAHASISSAQIKQLLASQLTPSGKAATIGSLLKNSGLVMPFRALEAGTLSVKWSYVPKGAKAAKAKPVLVVSGRMTFTGAGTGRLRLKLTAAGKHLFEHAKRLKLTAQGTFTPVGQVAPITAAAGLLLKR